VTVTAAATPVIEPTDDPRSPRLRLTALFDEGTLALITTEDDSGMLAGIGTIDGAPCVAFCSDATIQGGAMGKAGCEVVLAAYERALADDVPVIGLWHSGGARLREGVVSLHAVGLVFAIMTRASGKVPQISVVLGPAAGGAAYGPALTDVVILGPEGRVFVTGPDVVRSVTGEDVDALRLGGPEPHGRRSGVVHVVADTQEDAYLEARRLAALLGDQRTVGDVEDRDLSVFLPDSPKRAYDVHPIVASLLDDGTALELHPKWAPNVTTTLGRLGGRTVGVIANNPLRLGGCLDSASAEKAARFVRMCDAFGVPLVVVVDVPGYLPGVAYIAMNSRALGATRVFAWPGAEVAVMGAVAAVRILHRRRLAEVAEDVRGEVEAELAVEHELLAGGLARAQEIGVVDEVIEPARTRSALAKAIAAAPAVRGNHGNFPL
jgi:acetyl-CoA/propionyl-CoA carboxylase carboxyl transferase subunit